MNNCLQVEKREEIVRGSGVTKEQAFASAFSIFRKKTTNNVEEVIIKLEAEEVFILEEKINKKVEKFLWLFMPKEKKSYEIELRIVYSVKYINSKED